jgi:hypothetical protein
MEDDMTPEQFRSILREELDRARAADAEATWHFMLEDSGSADDPKPEVFAATILRRIRRDTAWLVRRAQRP